jgi:hypothetical protein
VAIHGDSGSQLVLYTVNDDVQPKESFNQGPYERKRWRVRFRVKENKYPQ